MNPILDGLGPGPNMAEPWQVFAVCQLAILRWRDQRDATPDERAVATELDALLGELARMWSRKP